MSDMRKSTTGPGRAPSLGKHTRADDAPAGRRLSARERTPTNLFTLTQLGGATGTDQYLNNSVNVGWLPNNVSVKTRLKKKAKKSVGTHVQTSVSGGGSGGSGAALSAGPAAHTLGKKTCASCGGAGHQRKTSLKCPLNHKNRSGKDNNVSSEETSEGSSSSSDEEDEEEDDEEDDEDEEKSEEEDEDEDDEDEEDEDKEDEEDEDEGGGSSSSSGGGSLDPAPAPQVFHSPSGAGSLEPAPVAVPKSVPLSELSPHHNATPSADHPDPTMSGSWSPSVKERFIKTAMNMHNDEHFSNMKMVIYDTLKKSSVFWISQIDLVVNTRRLAAVYTNIARQVRRGAGLGSPSEDLSNIREQVTIWYLADCMSEGTLSSPTDSQTSAVSQMLFDACEDRPGDVRVIYDISMQACSVDNGTFVQALLQIKNPVVDFPFGKIVLEMLKVYPHNVYSVKFKTECHKKLVQHFIQAYAAAHWDKKFN